MQCLDEEGIALDVRVKYRSKRSDQQGVSKLPAYASLLSRYPSVQRFWRREAKVVAADAL